MAQVKNIEENCSEIVNDCHNLYFDFNSVDSYQGKETDVIIYSVTRSNKNNNIGFLSEYERLNVALSRARNCLCIVGDSNFCYTSKNNNPFSGVINFIKNNPEDCEIKYI